TSLRRTAPRPAAGILLEGRDRKEDRSLSCQHLPRPLCTVLRANCPMHCPCIAQRKEGDHSFGGAGNRFRYLSARGIASNKNCLGSISHRPPYILDFDSETRTSAGSSINSAFHPGHHRLAFHFTCNHSLVQSQ